MIYIVPRSQIIKEDSRPFLIIGLSLMYTVTLQLPDRIGAVTTAKRVAEFETISESVRLQYYCMLCIFPTYYDINYVSKTM
jgi:hypothetical protein